MPLFTDQTGQSVFVPGIPRRIVSLVPSITELLYSLGLDQEVVGITKFCVHPPAWFRSKSRIGGTKNVRLESIRLLQPDLILANKEENVKEQVEELAHHYPVWVSDVRTLDDACRMIREIGVLTDRERQALTLVGNIRWEFDNLPLPAGPSPRTAYFIWRSPWMVAGGDTFIHDMLQRAGYTNLFREQNRYPTIDLPSLAAAGCENILLSSEPFPFRQQHIEEIRAVLPHASFQLVDGEMFSWYGSRLVQAPAYFGHIRR
jgi:ABC-type Fe3+-hydroxamate transport system substrate-binding protein